MLPRLPNWIDEETPIWHQSIIFVTMLRRMMMLDMLLRDPTHSFTQPQRLTNDTDRTLGTRCVAWLVASIYPLVPLLYVSVVLVVMERDVQYERYRDAMSQHSDEGTLNGVNDHRSTTWHGKTHQSCVQAATPLHGERHPRIVLHTNCEPMV